MKKAVSAFVAFIIMVAAMLTVTSCTVNEDGGSTGGVSIVDVSESEVEIDGVKYNRFTFTFSDGSVKSFDVENRAAVDGEDGKDGENGENGKDGKDGITPEFKIEGGALYVSYNGGTSWDMLGSVDGEKGDDGKDGVTPKFKLENNVLYVSYNNGVSWEELNDVGAGGTEPSEPEEEEAMFENYNVSASITNGYNGTNGIIVLMTDNDGGDFETIVRVDEIYRKYGLVGGLGTVAKNLYFDEERTIPKTEDIARWQQFLDTGRWKLVCHSMTHKKYASGSGTDFAIDDDRIYEEIVESGEVLRTLFPDQRVLTYAMTGNSSAVGVDDWSLRERERQLIEQYYIGGRFGTDGNPVAFGQVNYSTLPYETIYTSSLDDAIRKVNACADQGKFYIIFNHYVIEEEALSVLGQISWTSTDTMDALCAAVAERQNDGSLWCAHFEDAVMYMRERDTATLSAELVDGVLRITLTDEMDDDLYNHDLTVKVNLPAGTEAVKLVQGSRITYVKAQSDTNGTYALLNIKPDGGEALVYPASESDVPTAEESAPAKTPSVFAEELDEVLTFEDGSNTLEETGRLTLSPAEVTAKVVDKNGDKVVCIDKPIATADYSRMTFPVTVKNADSNAAVFEANLFIEYTSGNSIVQVLLMKDSAISMCRTYFTVELATKQLVFNTFNALGESESAKTTAKAGEWFNLRIEYYEGTADTVRIKTYVNNILVSVSDKYYHANTDYVVPADDTELCVVAPHYNFVGKVYVDDISYKQVVKEYEDETVPEIDTSTPTEHNFDYLSVHMGESIKYSAKYADSATVTQEQDGTNNYLKFTKIRTDEQPYVEFLNTVSADECNTYVLETKMKIEYTSGSKQVYLVLMCGSANNYAYHCYFNITESGELTFVDFNQGNTTTSTHNATTATVGEWFDLRIEFYEGTRETLKIKTYVNNSLVYESSNYYPAYAEGETIIDADGLSSVRFLPAWSFVGSVCLDDLSVKQINN